MVRGLGFICMNHRRRYIHREAYWLPKDLPLLAETLELPIDSVMRMIARGDIPRRCRMDSLGRVRRTAVFLTEAFDAIRVLRS